MALNTNHSFIHLDINFSICTNKRHTPKIIITVVIKGISTIRIVRLCACVISPMYEWTVYQPTLLHSNAILGRGQPGVNEMNFRMLLAPDQLLDLLTSFPRVATVPWLSPFGGLIRYRKRLFSVNTSFCDPSCRMDIVMASPIYCTSCTDLQLWSKWLVF